MSDEPDGDVGVTQLAAITGLSRESCAAMLSRANGDVTTAVNRHFAAHDTRDGGALASTSAPASQPRSSVVGEKRRRSSIAARGSPAKARLGSGAGDQQQRSVLSFFHKGQVDRAEAPEDHAPAPIAARAPQSRTTTPKRFRMLNRLARRSSRRSRCTARAPTRRGVPPPKEAPDHRGTTRRGRRPTPRRRTSSSPGVSTSCHPPPSAFGRETRSGACSWRS